MDLPLITPYSIRLGVVGAGTMGSGIALTALYADMIVTLYDVSPAILERAREYIEKHLQRKNRLEDRRNLTLTTRLEDLRGAGIVIEAIPEDLQMKQDLFTRLGDICPSPAVLATNTSTLSVTAIAAAARNPERVGGMHFFNPAPAMPLVEVIQGMQTSPEAVQTLVNLSQKLGKTAVVAGDTPGFIVNRVARPLYSEAIRLLSEGAASHEQIDLAVRLGGGFKMGPFQLMDLIGIDINLAAMQSLYEQTFGEPRFRPHPIQAQMVRQKTLGQKSGRGFYDYQSGSPAQDPSPPQPAKCSGQVWLSPGSWAPGMAELLRNAGFVLTNASFSIPVDPAFGIVTAGKAEGLEKQVVTFDRNLPLHTPLLCQCADITCTEVATWMQYPGRLVGFDGLFFHNGPVVTLVSSPVLTPQIRSQVETFFSSLGRLVVWMQDTPALILPRIICMLVNEAAFTAGENVANPETIDLAMRLGTGYPKGPLSWAKSIGYERVIAVLDHLHAEYGEDRYRVAPILRRWSRLEWVSA